MTTDDPSPFTLMYRPGDFDATVGYLRDVIGLELVTSWDDDGRGAIFAAGPGRIELFSDPDPSAVSGDRPHRPVDVADELPVSIAWEVDDVDHSVATWGRNGATIRSAPTDTPWQTRMAVVNGPDGLLLCPYSRRA